MNQLSVENFTIECVSLFDGHGSCEVRLVKESDEYVTLFFSTSPIEASKYGERLSKLMGCIMYYVEEFITTRVISYTEFQEEE